MHILSWFIDFGVILNLLIIKKLSSRCSVSGSLSWKMLLLTSPKDIPEKESFKEDFASRKYKENINDEHVWGFSAVLWDGKLFYVCPHVHLSSLPSNETQSQVQSRLPGANRLTDKRRRRGRQECLLQETGHKRNTQREEQLLSLLVSLFLSKGAFLRLPSEWNKKFST